MSDYQAMAQQAAAAAGIDPAIFMRLIDQESGWNPAAGSPAGAYGLTQLMPGTAKGLGVTDIADPQQQLDAGARYLRQQLDTFGSYPLALAAYNAGPGAVQRYGGIPPFAETQQYVKSIMGTPQPSTLPYDRSSASPQVDTLGGTITGSAETHTNFGKELPMAAPDGSSGTTTIDPTTGLPATGGAFSWDAALGQINDILDGVKASEPKADDPRYQPYNSTTNPDGGQNFQTDHGKWATTVTSLLTQQRQFQIAAAGLHEMPDGTTVSLGSLSPDQRAAVESANYNAYAKTMNDLGLSDFTAKNTAITQQNSAVNSDFNNRMAKFNAGVSYDSANLQRSGQEQQRWTAAQNVADQDAKNVAAAQLQAEQWGTSGGKTDFSPNDLGSIDQAYAKLLGIPADQPLLRYPGMQTLDPVGDRLASAAAMGISGAPPLVPAMTSDPSQIPASPTLQIPGTMPPPQLRPRAPMPPPNVGGSMPPPLLIGAQAAPSIGR